MTAHELHEMMLEGERFRLDENTVDRILIGDPDKPVSRVMVTYIGSMDAVEHAIAEGCDMLISHEPVFYTHRQEMQALDGQDRHCLYYQTGMAKVRRIQQAGLVVARLHDAWDFKPYYGMQERWARWLGFEGEPVARDSRDYERAFDISPVTLAELAERVAQRTALLGEPAIQRIGRPERVIRRVSLGPGWASTVEGGHRLGADATILCDDGNYFTGDIQLALDAGHSLIRVNHATSEEAGVIGMAEFIRDHVPGVEAIRHIHPAFFTIVQGKNAE
nr:Nif3-like dinuclear metal center hexameric protein [bacterium]